MSFATWLKRAHITDDPVGDFIEDARRDPRPQAFERVSSLDGLRRSLPLDACSECRATLPDVWKRYRRWEKARSRGVDLTSQPYQT